MRVRYSSFSSLNYTHNYFFYIGVQAGDGVGDAPRPLSRAPAASQVDMRQLRLRAQLDAPARPRV